MNLYLLKHNNQIVYVGQSKNIPRRIRRHALTKVFDEVEVVALNGRNPDVEEARLIAQHNPKYNKGIPYQKTIVDFQGLMEELGVGYDAAMETLNRIPELRIGSLKGVDMYDLGVLDE